MITTKKIADVLRSARSHDLTSLNHILTLLEISEVEPIRIGELARRLEMTAPTITQITEHLVSLNFAVREHTKEDRRVILIRATRLGTEIQNKILN